MNVSIAAAILVLSLFGRIQQEKPASQEKPSSHDMSSCPMHEQHQAAAQDKHHQGVVERGDRAMGFSDENTAHHFRLYADGGAIEAEAKDTQDAASRDAIRSHFAHIAKMFAAGDFSIPMLIHAENPPGTETMKRFRDAIQYEVENTARGGRIRIITKDADALHAVHTFLRFQIAEHQTGDSTVVTAAP
jgi:hypothetical protein